MNKEEKKEYNKQYYFDNKEKMRQYYIENKEKRKQYLIKNKDKILKQHKEYRGNNPEMIRKCHKNWAKNNRLYEVKRRKINLKLNLNYKMGKNIGKALKGNKAGRTWESLTGYTLNNLIKRLKKTITEGYTWKDFLSGELHIDHIIPMDAFNFTRPEHTDFKRCWALENLRLLPAKENRIKHTKLDRPFQPALRI